MKRDRLFLFIPQILEYDRKIWIQISSFVQPALYFCCRKTSLFKNLRIWKKTNPGSCFSGLCNNREQTVFQFDRRNPSLVTVIVHATFTSYFYFQPFGQGIYNGRSDTMQTAACLIDRIIKLTACMQRRENETFCRHAFFVHAHRNTTSIVFDGCRAVFFQCHFNAVTETSQMFIHRVIYDFIY